MSDGASVYECTSDDEVIDLVQGGQGVFGIALGKVWRELEGSLASFPVDHPDEPCRLHPLASSTNWPPAARLARTRVRPAPRPLGVRMPRPPRDLAR